MADTRYDPTVITRQLIRCRSVTPADDGAQDLLRGLLTPLGFDCHDVPFGDIRNLFARIGTDGPHICFAGHTDVVPPGDESLWTHPPFDAVIADGILYGRGASDMKSNVACFVAACARYIDKHGTPPGSISLLITGDEEAAAINGTVKVLPWMKERGHNPDVALVGEPSNPDHHGQEIKIGRRGSLNGTLTVTGTQGHVAYPQRADNPLPRLIKLLDVLASHKFDDGTKFFQPTNLQISTIDVGNSAANVIPAQGRAKFNVRFNNLWTAQTLEAKIRELLDSVTTDYILDTESNAESFQTAPGAFTDIVRDAVADISGHTPALTTTGGTSDARFVQAYCPVVEYGLVNATIHKIDENSRVEDIEMLAQIYLRVLENYFAVGS